MSRWKIERRQGACAACERAFGDGERHRSALLLSCDVPARRDLCDTCWEHRTARGADPSELLELGAPVGTDGSAADPSTGPQEASDPQPGGAEDAAAGTETGSPAGAGEVREPELAESVELFWWSTVHHVAPRKSVQMDLETLERLFGELEGRGEQRLRELRYVVCLLLMRKRRLKVERVTRSPQGEFFVVRRPKEEQALQVEVFDFTPERMDEVRHELQAIFDGAEDEDGVLLPLDGSDAEPAADVPGEGAADDGARAQEGAGPAEFEAEGAEADAASGGEPDGEGSGTPDPALRA